jgi:hypothetical protein
MSAVNKCSHLIVINYTGRQKAPPRAGWKAWKPGGLKAGKLQSRDARRLEGYKAERSKEKGERIKDKDKR